MNTNTACTSLRGVTIFVRAINGGFFAETIRQDAYGVTAEIAARRAAARFFETTEDRIELTRENDHVLIGHIATPKPPHDPRRTLALVAAMLAAISVTAIVGIVYLKGGH